MSAGVRTGVLSRARTALFGPATRQKLLIKKAELTQSRLMFVREAFRKLCADEHFMTLLRAEGLETMPADLARPVTDGAPA